MTMAAPYPKDPSERRNRTKPARGEWIDLPSATLEEPVLPLTPPQKRSWVPFGAAARRKWSEWRLDPVTTYWTRGDVSFALSTLELYDVEDWTIHAAEIRLREDRLALSPKGKRDQRFRILFGVGKEATRERTPGDVNVISMDERRKALEHGA
jgi:hypothetical protein